MYVASEKCLRGHVIATVVSPHPILCAFACLRNNRCRSMNYYRAEGLCELNGVGTDGARTSDWFYAADCVYYQSQNTTIGWPVALEAP